MPKPFDFTTAVAVMFSAYYVFNVEYPEKSNCSLELIQRSA
jgi:hypothetical protein